MADRPIIVAKFGGSSLADVGALRRVARQVVGRQREGVRMVVVVSAMGKTTDRLIEQAKEVSTQPPRRELDMLVTAGERISMAMLSMAIAEEGEQAISFTGSQSGIITEDSHQGARIIEVKPYRIEHELQSDRIVIVAGYQGVSLKREVTTLGRGGSDTSAVALAAALGAQACEIYSDVDGVYSADPRVCPQAQLLPELDYASMQAMAASGAKVLNADAVRFAERAGITILARKTGDDSGRQTSVREDVTPMRDVLAVVGSEVTRLRGMFDGSVGTLFEELFACGARVISHTHAEELQTLVDRTNIPGRSSDPIQVIAKDAQVLSQDLGMVSLIGPGVWRPEVVSRAERVLAELGIGTRGSQFAGPSCRWLTDPDATERAVRALHGHFVEGS